MTLRKKFFLTTVVVLVYVLHQDFWNWRKYEPLLFNFLPIGLTYHIGYSVAASVMMALLVRFAWPKHLENVVPDSASGDGSEPTATGPSATGGDPSPPRR